MTSNCSYVVPPDFKIISGGQSGADRGGLNFAINNNLSHGGWCPKGRRSDNGIIPAIYNLQEHPSPNHLDMMEANILMADFTLIFARRISINTNQIAAIAKRRKTPFLVLNVWCDKDYLKAFILECSPRVLNIAGNVESVSPGICAGVEGFLNLILNVKRK